MKDMIQRMTDLENKNTQTLNESTQLEACGSPEGPGMSPMDQGNPVSMNVSLNASGKEHVADLIDMMKNAGMKGAEEVSTAMMPMRTDMERLRDVVDGPKDDKPVMKLPAPEDADIEDEPLEGYENEPDEQYDDHETMIHDLSGGINRKKKSYKASEPGDNAMAVEDIAKQLYAALSEKKAKPDYIDIDGDGDKKEPMKKAAKDKKEKK